MNIHIVQDQMAQVEINNLLNIENHIRTSQKNAPIVSLVQNTLLGLYLLTQDSTTVPTHIAFDCFSMIESFEFNDFTKRVRLHYPNLFQGLKFKSSIPGKVVFSALLPRSFKYELNGVIIKDGIMLSESKPIDKNTVGNKVCAIHDYIYLEYSQLECIRFLSESQFVINHWLSFRGFSVSIDDCLINNHDKIEEQLLKSKIECQQKVDQSTDPELTEKEVTFILNSVTSASAKLVSDGLKLGDKNNLVIMEKSGAKGSKTNYLQISAFLGQQNTNCTRIQPTLAGNTQTLPYYKKNDNSPEARGFIDRSYFDGLSPQQCFFASAAGREGIIDTSMKTKQTGYIERRIMKKVEDLKIHHDHTVRNNTNCIIDWIYGDDASDATFLYHATGVKGLFFIDCIRVAEILNYPVGDEKVSTRKLFEYEINDILDEIKINPVKSELIEYKTNIVRDKLRNVLKDIELNPEKISEFKKIIIKKFYGSLCNPGEYVGPIAATSLGEPTTQGSLKNWEARTSGSGKNTTTGIPRLEELLGCTKNPKTPSCLIYVEDEETKKIQQRLFNETDEKKINEIRMEGLKYIYGLRNHIQYASVETLLKINDKTKMIKRVAEDQPAGNPLDIIKYDDYVEEWWVDYYDKNIENRQTEKKDWVLELTFDVDKIKDFGLTMEEIAIKIVENITSAEVDCIPSPLAIGKMMIYIDFDMIKDQVRNKQLKSAIVTEENFNFFYLRDVIIDNIKNIKICGINNISDVYFEESYDPITKIQELKIDTQGSNLKQVLSLPFCGSRTSSDDMWDVYKTLGINAVRKMLIREIKKTLCGDGTYINERHINLLVNSMTNQGTIMAVRRTGIENDVGPLTKCAFEKTLENFCEAGMFGRIDNLSTVSARIVVGERINGGTGFCDLLPNYEMKKEEKFEKKEKWGKEEKNSKWGKEEKKREYVDLF